MWNRLYDKPFFARRSATGVLISPPNALEAPKPTSSNKITRTFGAPSGGRRGSMGGYDVSGSFASNVVSPGFGMSGMGKTVRGVLEGANV